MIVFRDQWWALQLELRRWITQAEPLLDCQGLLQGHLEGAGTDPCPQRQLDHRVRDPDCDYCKQAIGTLYRHRIKGNRHLPVFPFDFSGPHPHHVSAAQYPLVCVEFGRHEVSVAFGVENRQSATVLLVPCLQSAFGDSRSLTGGS